jgi:hypothetical protein
MNADQLALIQTAQSLGLDPREFGALISFETAGTFSPTIMGGDNGAYRGLIQFSPDNQKRYGIRGDMSVAEQLPAVKRYLLDRGFRPGEHGIGHAYSAVLAGNADERYWNRTDSNGTSVANAIDRFRAGPHYQNAVDFLNKGIDPRMAGGTGGYAVSPHTLPDKGFAPEYPGMTPPINPNGPVYEDYLSGLHPQLQALLGQQQKKKDPWEFLGALGAGILSSKGGGNWFGEGMRYAMEQTQRGSPEQLNLLQMLQANNELYELDARRAEAQRARQQQAMQREYLQEIANDESLPMQTRLQARNQLMGLKGNDIEIPVYEENWTTSGSPSQGLYRVNPDTGETELLIEPTEQGASEPQYGTGANWVRLGQNEDGTTRWGTLRLNDRGEQEVVPLPEGAEPWTGVQNDPEMIREREKARAYGGLEPEAIQGMSEQLASAKTQLAQTNFLLRELESGKYDGDLGPIRGPIKRFFSPQTALFEMYAVDAALKNLQTVNLAPVTEFELDLIMRMDANAFRTVSQNKAVLRRLKEIREAKVRIMDEAMRRIRTEGYESFLKNPPELDEKLFDPIEDDSGWSFAPSEPEEDKYGGKDPSELVWK